MVCMSLTIITADDGLIVDTGVSDTGHIRLQSASDAPGLELAYGDTPYGGMYASGTDNGLTIDSKYTGGLGPINLAINSVPKLVLTPDGTVTSFNSQAGKTTLGNSRRLIIRDLDG